MGKYIDAEKLKAEIKGLQCEQGFEDGMEERGYQFAIKDILDTLDSLQQEQPEVDLEKEIQEHIKECLDVKFPTTDIELIRKDVAYTARKFYELGLNARKED